LVELVELQAIAYVAQIVGVVGTLTAAFIAVRSYLNANKRAEESKKKEQETRDRDLETRQAQLFMQIFIVNQGKELADVWFKLYSTDLSDTKGIVNAIYVTGDEKYHDLAHMIAMVGTHYDGIGLYARKGLVDLDMVKELLAGDVIMMWEKLRPLMMEVRKSSPFTVESFEWLYDRLKLMQVKPSPLIS
jgi:hypothetical protein